MVVVKLVELVRPDFGGEELCAKMSLDGTEASRLTYILGLDIKPSSEQLFEMRIARVLWSLDLHGKWRFVRVPWNMMNRMPPGLGHRQREREVHERVK